MHYASFSFLPGVERDRPATDLMAVVGALMVVTTTH